MNEREFFLCGEKKTSEQAHKVVNPFNDQVEYSTFLATPKQIEEAITKAHAARKTLASTPSYVRKNACLQIASEIKSKKKELAQTISREAGKPLKNALGEVERAVSTFEFAADEASRIGGELVSLDSSPAYEKCFGLFKRFPIGLVAGITPFNFPLNLAAHKIAPAIACGCPIIIKPASATPISALNLVEIISGTNLPKEAVSVLPCNSSNATPLVEDERIKLVTFTGSPQVGWDIKKRAGKKRVTLELGGNAASVINEDADIENAATRLTTAGFSYAGQSCIKTQRILVHQKIFDDFLQTFVPKVKALRVGNPLDENTDVGPVIDEKSAVRIESWMQEAVAGGARVECGGKREGNIIHPTVLTNAPRDALVCTSEIFGPVVVVSAFTDFKQAIEEVNNSRYGLQASVFTNDVNKIMHAFNELEVGGVIINDASAFRSDNMPYGGVKDSGFGREGPHYAIEEMTEIKMLALRQK